MKAGIQETVSNGPGGVDAASIMKKTDGLGSSLAKEYHNFIADIEDLVSATALMTGEELAHAKRKINERVATAKASLEELGGKVTERARKTATDTDQYVHEQPWQAIGIGAAVGMLLGFVLARRG